MGDLAHQRVVGGDDAGIAEAAFERDEARQEKRRAGGSPGPCAGLKALRAENAASSLSTSMPLPGKPAA